jgi:hypothetical protein
MTQYFISRSDSSMQSQRSCLVSFLRPDTTLSPRALTSETATAATTTSNNREEEGGSRRGAVNSCCCRPSQEGRGRHSAGSHHGMKGHCRIGLCVLWVYFVCMYVCLCVCVCVMIRQRPRHQDRPKDTTMIRCFSVDLAVADTCSSPPCAMFHGKKKRDKRAGIIHFAPSSKRMHE